MTRLLPLSLALLLVQAVFRVTEAKDVQGDSWCGDLMCVTAFVNESVVTYQMSALNQLGWMAIGFGTIMADSAMIIMWPNSDGSVTMSQRNATGLVEPLVDPLPPRVATKFAPLISISSIPATLSFTISKTDATIQSHIWALGVSNPNSSDPAVFLLQHLDSGQFNLNLTGEIDTDAPIGKPSQTIFNPSSTGAQTTPSISPSPSAASSESDTEPLQAFEKLIIVHAALCVVGFLVMLPLGALVARWGRTFTPKWFYYHWTIQVVICIPLIVIGWSLGPISVAEQGLHHANDAHKICGILLLPLYFIQLCFGSFIHFRKPEYPIRHPPRNFGHAALGILIIALAFFQARTGMTVEWKKVTSRSIRLDIFSNLWIAWAIFIPVFYAAGFALIRHQRAHERELPPPYSPRDESPDRSESGTGVRRLLGLEQSDDDGTHDVFSERTSGDRNPTSTGSSNDIEMREVAAERWVPISRTTLMRSSTR